MKKQTYDVPAYKVGILAIQNERNKNHTVEDYQRAIDSQRVTIVPFEDVDGLLVSELQELLGLKEVMVQFYYKYQTQEIVRSSRMHYDQAIVYAMWFYIGEDILEENLSKPIDQVIEEILEELYDKQDETEQRYANCFFERYQDKSYELTKQRIKRLTEQKDK